MKKRIQVVLKLGRLSVQEKVTKAKFIVASMTGNAYFTTPSPDLATITTDANNLETAAAAAEGGGVKFTADMHRKADILDNDLNALAVYVEVVANAPANFPNAVPIITSAGMEVKATKPRTANDFKVRSTGVGGEVKLQTAYKYNVIYHWQQSRDGITWTEIGVSRKASFIQEGLIPETKYYFRVAVEDNNGLGIWSDPVSSIVL